MEGTFDRLKERIFRCCDDVDIETIDRTIESSPRKIISVIKGHGCRSKYWNNILYSYLIARVCYLY